MVFESYLYKRAVCLREYSNLQTLERRVLSIARALAANQHHLLFTYFDLR
jgi:ABC-type branched-subunit amino acid transport system ATPase component